MSRSGNIWIRREIVQWSELMEMKAKSWHKHRKVRGRRKAWMKFSVNEKEMECVVNWKSKREIVCVVEWKLD